MAALEIAPEGTHFVHAGRPFPLILDTVWATFAEASEDEWRHYLAVRRQQGFTGMLISILPVLHDRTEQGGREPFAFNADGSPYDFDRPDPAYFEQAREYVRIAAADGLVSALGVLWSNYLPDTWGAALTPGSVMTPAQRTAYVSLVARTFADLAPIFVISGDDHFRQQAAIDGYTEALAQLAKEAPNTLKTMHLSPHAVLPRHIADSPDLHFYSYQSGHNVTCQELNHELGARYRTEPVRRPIVNVEPAYEQHGRVDGVGRWTAADVRTAMWWSLLGGATAGMGYGAHGMWSWHRPGGRFLAVDASAEPADWRSALGLPGARDVSLLRALWEQHALYALEPAQDLIVRAPGGTRVARRDDGGLVAVYTPSPGAVRLALAVDGLTAHGWDLGARAPVHARLHGDGEGLVVDRLDVLGDAVLFLERR